MFLVTLFMMVSILNKLWNTCVKGHHSAVRTDELLARAATWTDLRCIREESQTSETTHCMSPFTGNTFGTWNRPVVARGWAGRSCWLQRGTGNFLEWCSVSPCLGCDSSSTTTFVRTCRDAHWQWWILVYVNYTLEKLGENNQDSAN